MLLWFCWWFWYLKIKWTWVWGGLFNSRIVYLYFFLLIPADHYIWDKMCRTWSLHCSWDWSRWPSNWWYNNLLCSGGICLVILSPEGIWPRNPWRRIHFLITLHLIHVGHHICKWNSRCFSKSIPSMKLADFKMSCGHFLTFYLYSVKHF